MKQLTTIAFFFIGLFCFSMFTSCSRVETLEINEVDRDNIIPNDVTNDSLSKVDIDL